ncbi:MAG: hypothetical protein HPY53_04390 [Brevinematales bacterium]|nr:hypothetical protein [Brevinematales bacterium]
MLSKLRWLGTLPVMLAVMGLAACEITIKFAPSVSIASPDAYEAVADNFLLAGTVSDGGGSVDGVYVKVGSSGTWVVVPGTENLASASDLSWSYNVPLSSVSDNSYFTVYVKGVSGSLDSFIKSRTYWKGGAFDENEPNDSYYFADTLTAGAAVFSGQIQPSGDEDWYKVYLLNGVSYTIETSSLSAGSDVDTYIYLYGTDHYTIKDYDNDSGAGTFSLVPFIPSASGTYYIQVKANTSGTALSGTYYIRVY